MLDTLCPMHVRLGKDGQILHAGPTVTKILGVKNVDGLLFLDKFEILRPRSVKTFANLRDYAGKKLHLQLLDDDKTQLKAVVANFPDGTAIVNLSFGIHVLDAVVDFSLTSTDFAPTDLAMEMLYIVEAKSAAMEETRMLNNRLQGAKMAAERRADTDTLTGLRNRRALNTALEHAIAAKHPFSLLRVDLDYFKQINDGHGHAVGDFVLQQASQIMQSLARKEDLVARVGGDEFVILLHGVSRKSRIIQISQDIISYLENEIVHRNERLKVSASIGISSVLKAGKTADDLLEEADIALYGSKRAGRARYTFFKPGMSLGEP